MMVADGERLNAYSDNAIAFKLSETCSSITHCDKKGRDNPSFLDIWKMMMPGMTIQEGGRSQWENNGFD
eukprot:scaffold26716_cov137-Cylindrotheca_fusiformis.AAC.3